MEFSFINIVEECNFVFSKSSGVMKRPNKTSSVVSEKEELLVELNHSTTPSE